MPSKSQYPRDIAPWSTKRLLSDIVEGGPYEQKVIQGTNKKQFLLFFCWMPEPLSSSSSSASPAPTPIPTPRPKKKGGRRIKLEPSPSPSAGAKRPRSLTTAEVASLPKRPGAVTRRKAQAMGPGEEEELEPLEDILRALE
jgi:hypothetical protein